MQSRGPADELRDWADELTLAHFGMRFPGQVRLAPRLRYRAGDFTPATVTIRLSGPYLARYGAEAARQVLLHELCHWWLYREGIPHRENAAVFQSLLRVHGAPARALAVPRAPRRGTAVYVCPRCHARYQLRPGRARACGHCCRRWAGGRFDRRFVLVLERRGGAHP
jgi:SprT-like protein